MRRCATAAEVAVAVVAVGSRCCTWVANKLAKSVNHRVTAGAAIAVALGLATGLPVDVVCRKTAVALAVAGYRQTLVTNVYNTAYRQDTLPYITCRRDELRA